MTPKAKHTTLILLGILVMILTLLACSQQVKSQSVCPILNAESVELTQFGMPVHFVKKLFVTH